MPTVALRRFGPALAAASLVTGVVALWFRFNATPPGFGLEFPSDFVFYFYPLTARVADRLAAGELPLWNPYGCAGIPLLATMQVAAFYPGTWLSLLLPADRALAALMFLETLLGASFAYAFFRARASSRAASVAGGFLFAFGCLLGQSFWPAALSTLLWLPWLLLCVERLAQAWRWRWWIALAAGVALQVLAGFPQYVVYSMYGVGPFAAVRLFEMLREGSRDFARTAAVAAGLAGAVALGAGVAGIQLLPTLELVGESSRASDLTPEKTHYLGAQTSVAGFLQNAIDPSPKNIAFGYGGDTGYLGIATLLLAALGFVTGWRSAGVWFWLGIGSAGLVLSQGWIGWTAPLHALYAALPTGGTFRTPERLQLLPLFAAIALAVRGLDAFAAATVPRRTRQAALGAAALLATIAAAGGGPGAAWRAIAAIAAIAVMSASRRRPTRARDMRALLVALVVVDGLLATAPFGSLRALPSAWARSVNLLGHTALAPEQANQLQPPDHARADWSPLQPPIAAGPLAQIQRISCYEPLLPRAWQEFQSLSDERAPLIAAQRAIGKVAFDDVAGVARSLVPRSLVAMTPEIDERLQRALQQRFADGAPPDPAASPVATAAIVDNPDALPRAYVVFDFEVTPLHVALERVIDGKHDFRASVLVDREPGSWARSTHAKPLEPAVIRSLEPERVEIDATPSADGLLVLSDTFYPGWRATVDGAEVEILRANGLFRAIRIPAGHHLVVFDYAPRSVRRGAWTTGLSLLAIVVVPLAARRLRKVR
jgi:hypothetical protein